MDHGDGARTPGRSHTREEHVETRSMIKEAVELLLLSYRENAAKDAPGNAIWETLTVDVPAA